MSGFPIKSDNFYTLLGKTLVLFEEMVDAEKMLASSVIGASGLKDHAMAESLVAHLNAEEIRRTLVTLLGIFYKDHKYMLAVCRHLMKRVETANRARNNLVHAYHSVSSDQKNSTTFRFSRREGYHNQMVSVVNEKQLTEHCDELFDLKILALRILYLVTHAPLRAYGNFGIKGRKIYVRDHDDAVMKLFPGLERTWQPNN
jgi:hypothetical protein